MSGKYVPPSRRPGYTPNSTDLPPPAPAFRSYQSRPRQPIINLTELQTIFKHPQTHTLTFITWDDPPPPRERYHPPYDPSGTPLTIPLPPSPPPPPPAHPLGHLLSYISIFPFAQPAWESNKELRTHTGADKIIEDWEAGGKKNVGRPVPVFRLLRKNGSEMVFEGWW